MKIVYVIRSQKDLSVYSGNTSNFEARFKRHNNREVLSTKGRVPWTHICHIVFEDNQLAYDFERYLKAGSGRAFIKKHFLK